MLFCQSHWHHLTRLCYAATLFKCRSNRLSASAACLSTDRFHGSSGPAFLVGRPVRELLLCRCSENSVEKLATESRGMQLRLEDLRIGDLYKGKISGVESYGVFVDIGTHVDGFVHNSRLSQSLHLRTEGAAVRVGQDVTVQIVDLDPRAHSLSLLLAPDEKEITGTLNLEPLNVSERETRSRVAARRAKKIAAQCADTLSTRRVVSLETRQRLKAHRRAVLAEQQAIQLYLARSRISFRQIPDSVPAVDDPPG